VTELERRQVLDAIAAEVRVCTKCRLHETRTNAVPGEGDPETEVVFVGEGPGFNEDRGGRPFIGRAGDLLVKLLASIGWRREEVFITNIVKCRPPDNRDPMPEEVAACAPYLRRQLEALDPAVVVTLGRHSMARFMPGARISQAHGTVRPVDPETGARDALVFAMYHPAAALRTPAIEAESYADIAGVPIALLDARRRREVARSPHQPDDERPATGGPEPARSVVVTAEPGIALETTAAEPAPTPAAAANPTVEPTEVAGPFDPSAHPGDPPTPQLTLF
jgi:uracil-DNA glycosylase family 4